jgi:hypothetical protein
MHDNLKYQGLINHFTITLCMSSNTTTSTDIIEIRKVQALTGERSFTLVFPKHFAVELGIGRGDFCKCQVDGNRLIVEKMNP